jgi:hypothetical protein
MGNISVVDISAVDILVNDFLLSPASRTKKALQPVWPKRFSKVTEQLV